MKRILTALVFILVACQVFASTYKIRSYSFEVDGKSKKSSLLEFVDSKDKEKDKTFDSLEKMIAFLDDKRQQLINKRVFYGVEYTYELEETSADVFEADVVFYIEDAGTFVIVPYPKYDSNYGINLKLKAKDANFLGTFTTLDSSLAFTQRNNSFKDGKLEWDFSVDQMRLGDAKFSFSHYGAVDFLTWTDSYLKGSASISNVKFWDLAVSGSFSFKVAPKGPEKDSGWGGSELSSSVGVSFLNPKFNSASVSNSLTYTFSSKKLETSTSFSFLYSEKLGVTSSTSVSTVQYGFEDGLYSIKVGTGVSKGFTIFKRINFSPSLWVYVEYTFPARAIDPYPTLTLPFSFGRIDWVGDNNFRKGLTFSFTASDDYHVLYATEFWNKHRAKLTGNVTFHYPVTSWFNPSARMNFILANTEQNINDSNVYSWNMRGIMDNNETINRYRKFAMTFNLDLMFNFIKINGFCKTYAIAFTDLFVGRNDDGSLDKLMTVGGEGIIILDSHPSYPIRGSLAFNADHLVKFIKGEMDIRDVEFELYIGLDFFY